MIVTQHPTPQAPSFAPSLPVDKGRLPQPDEADRARSSELVARLAQRICAAGGWLRFDEFMQAALYEPGLGYYDAPGSKFGVQGDFTTAPEISPLFARAIARQLAPAFADSPGGLPERILEFGAGSGALAGELIAELQRLGHSRLRYEILEISSDLRARQQERLSGLPVRWLTQLPEEFEGVIIANEVLDVLPVRLFQRAAAGVLERGVVVEENSLRLANREAPADLVQAVQEIEEIAGTMPDGYGSEWCPLAGAWIHALGASLKRGYALLIDYGFPRREYYHPQRAMGTLMCHYRQHAHAEPLWMPGCNDITAHVDFSACARTAQEAGLETLGYTSQAHFLLNCGILDLLMESSHGQVDPAQAGALQRLVSEAEMGELVKVLALGRGADLPMPGFVRGDRSHRL